MAPKKKNGRNSARPIAQQGRRAVVDIGSNSVRLVVYDGPRRTPIPICNEKSLCGLGRDMTSDGALNPSSAADALATLTRFERLLREYGDPPVHVIATAAVRNAKDGKSFVKAIETLGFKVNVLSGAEEAALAALGVVSFEPGATGLAGDMGGGSLELVTLKNGGIKESTSLSIGPLTVMSRVGNDVNAARKLINAELDDVKWLKPKSFDTLYSVGGAWRAVARIHMRLRSYPLTVLHHYELTRIQIFDICDLVARQSRRSLEEIPGIQQRRLDTLPFAAIVLKSVIERAGIQRVVISSGGVREGLLYQELSKEERKDDPLLVAARYYAEKLAPDTSFGEAVLGVLDPLFQADSEDARRLRHAACLMVDIGAYFHPEHRARQAFDTALRAPLMGVSHADRVAIALALYRRYSGRTESLPHEQAIGLLSWDEQQRALQIGLALRFVASLSPKISAPIKDCRLFRKGQKLVFQGPKHLEMLMGETPQKRFNALASFYEAEPVAVFED